MEIWHLLSLRDKNPRKDSTYTTSCLVSSSSLTQSVSQKQRDGPDRWIGGTVVCEWGEKWGKKYCPLGFIWLRGAHVWVRVCFTVRYSCEGEMTSTVCFVSNFMFAIQPQEEWTIRDSSHLRHTSLSNTSRRRPREGPISRRVTSFAPVPQSGRQKALHVLSHFPDFFFFFFSCSERTRDACSVYKSNESGNALPLL